MKLHEILEEATRRDFLKGLGAAAVTAAIGIGLGYFIRDSKHENI
jgi:hypothetical protein